MPVRWAASTAVCVAALLGLATAPQCHTFAGQALGQGQIKTTSAKTAVILSLRSACRGTV